MVMGEIFGKLYAYLKHSGAEGLFYIQRVVTQERVHKTYKMVPFLLDIPIGLV